MQLNQVTLPALDMGASVQFYLALGLKAIVASSDYYRFEAPDGDATLSLHLTSEPPRDPGVVVYLECDDLEAEVDRLRQAEIGFECGPVDQPWLWREAYLRDPAGNRLCLFHAGANRRYPPWRIAPDGT